MNDDNWKFGNNDDWITIAVNLNQWESVPSFAFANRIGRVGARAGAKNAAEKARDRSAAAALRNGFVVGGSGGRLGSAGHDFAVDHGFMYCEIVRACNECGQRYMSFTFREYCKIKCEWLNQANAGLGLGFFERAIEIIIKQRRRTLMITKWQIANHSTQKDLMTDELNTEPA